MTDSRIAQLFTTVFPSAFGRLSVTCERNDERREMSVAAVESRNDSLHAVVQTVFYDPSGKVVDVRHDPVYIGPTADVPGIDALDEASLRACIPSIHQAGTPWLEKIDHRHNVVNAFPLRLVHFAALCASEGPTPPRPERFEDAEQIAARLASRVEVLRPEDDAVPELDGALFALRVGAWALAFVVGENDGRVVLVAPDGEQSTILDLGIDGHQSFCAYPFDSDTVTQRGVYDILALALRVGGKDEPLAGARDEDEDEDDDDLVPDKTIAVYLLFRAGDEPQLDWRLQGDSIGEGPLRDGADPVLREKHPRVAAQFDRFVREVIDPRFVAKTA